MKNTFQIQKVIFEKIKTVVGEKQLAKSLGNHLNLENSAIYKRIRLEQAISIDDLIKLSNAYNLSFQN